MITKQLRDAVALTTVGRPTVQEWLTDASELDECIAAAVAGVYSGTAGEARGAIPGTDLVLVVQWCYGIVEVAYIS